MNIDPYSGKLAATKSETKRFVEARILAEVASRSTGDEKEAAFFESVANDNLRAARMIGAKHLTPEGYLKESATEARQSAAVPQ